MAKDAQGHGSNGRGGGFVQGLQPMTPEQQKTLLGRNVAAAKTSYSGDASGNRNSPLVSNAAAAAQLASGPKSDAVPVHDSMHPGQNVDWNMGGMPPARSADSRQGYSRDAVNAAIASSNRSGRKIGGKEASAIHRLLKGWR